jgi:hypothetical protein
MYTVVTIVRFLLLVNLFGECRQVAVVITGKYRAPGYTRRLKGSKLSWDIEFKTAGICITVYGQTSEFACVRAS